MLPWQADRLVEAFRRKCWLATAGKEDECGLPDKLWDLLSREPRVCSAVVPRLWALVPAGTRDGFAAALHRAASPEFRLPPWIRGEPMTMEELEQDAELRSSRVRAWAAEFGRFLAAPGDCAGVIKPDGRRVQNGLPLSVNSATPAGASAPLP